MKNNINISIEHSEFVLSIFLIIYIIYYLHTNVIFYKQI
jgi:hypothetical protein